MPSCSQQANNPCPILLTPSPVPLTPYRSPRTPHPIPLTPYPSPHTPHPIPLTPYPSPRHHKSTSHMQLVWATMQPQLDHYTHPSLHPPPHISPNSPILSTTTYISLHHPFYAPSPRLADFGLCELLNPDHTHVSNHDKGTPFYMAPETMLHHQVGAHVGSGGGGRHACVVRGGRGRHCVCCWLHMDVFLVRGGVHGACVHQRLCQCVCGEGRGHVCVVCVGGCMRLPVCVSVCVGGCLHLSVCVCVVVCVCGAYVCQCVRGEV